MDFALQIDSRGLAAMTFGKSETMINNIYLSLMVKKGSFFYDPTFGSRLHELGREKNTPATARKAEDYCREALQWLLDTGKATLINVYTEKDLAQDPHRLKALVEVTPANGPVVPFSTFIDVV
jgi:phage gp46-like protein